MTRGLGFNEEDLDRGLDTFSGGQLTRASLARTLATGADLIALDEPRTTSTSSRWSGSSRRSWG